MWGGWNVATPLNDCCSAKPSPGSVGLLGLSLRHGDRWTGHMTVMSSTPPPARTPRPLMLSEKKKKSHNEGKSVRDSEAGLFQGWIIPCLSAEEWRYCCHDYLLKSFTVCHTDNCALRVLDKASVSTDEDSGRARPAKRSSLKPWVNLCFYCSLNQVSPCSGCDAVFNERRTRSPASERWHLRTWWNVR